MLRSLVGSEMCIRDRYKELMFCMNFIIKDVFRKRGVNNKYIPLLMDKCSPEDVPSILLTPQKYRIPSDKDALLRRIFHVAECSLPPLTKQKSFNPKVL